MCFLHLPQANVSEVANLAKRIVSVTHRPGNALRRPRKHATHHLLVPQRHNLHSLPTYHIPTETNILIWLRLVYSLIQCTLLNYCTVEVERGTWAAACLEPDGANRSS